MQTPDSTPLPNAELTTETPTFGAPAQRDAEFVSHPEAPPLPEPFGPSRHCPRCNAPLENNAIFCAQCGERLDGKPLGCSQWLAVGCLGLGAFMVGGLGSCLAALGLGIDDQIMVVMILGGLIFAVAAMILLARSMRRR